MRSLRKRMERAALGYRQRTGLAACATMDCWTHSSYDPPKPETKFRFSWFRSRGYGMCRVEDFPDIESLESFAQTVELETPEDA